MKLSPRKTRTAIIIQELLDRRVKVDKKIWKLNKEKEEINSKISKYVDVLCEPEISKDYLIKCLVEIEKLCK